MVNGSQTLCRVIRFYKGCENMSDGENSSMRRIPLRGSARTETLNPTTRPRLSGAMEFAPFLIQSTKSGRTGGAIMWLGLT